MRLMRHVNHVEMSKFNNVFQRTSQLIVHSQYPSSENVVLYNAANPHLMVSRAGKGVHMDSMIKFFCENHVPVSRLVDRREFLNENLGEFVFDDRDRGGGASHIEEGKLRLFRF